MGTPANPLNPTDPNSIAARVLLTSLPVVQAATLAAVQTQVANINNNLKSNYLTAFNNWLINWNAGRVSDKSTAPVPPLGFVVGYFNDPTSGPGAVGPYGTTVVQWAYPEQGTAQVCAQPAIPDMPSPQVNPNPVVTENGAKMNVPVGDTIPVGDEITAPDGSKWMKMSSPTPFGIATWYEKVG